MGTAARWLDLHELFKSEKRHCPHCQVREKSVQDAQGAKRTVLEYYHQAVALSWVRGELPVVLGWELLAPGEGELTAALRLLGRLLPRLRHSLDLILGDALYCCRPFFQLVCGAGLQALALSSRQTEMDSEIDLPMASEPPRLIPGLNIAVGELESEAWREDLHRTLRVIHCERRDGAAPWKHEREQLRVVTSTPVALLRRLADAGVLAPRDRPLPQRPLTLRAVVSAGTHRGLGSVPGSRLNRTGQAGRLDAPSGAEEPPADGEPCGRGLAIATQPARSTLSLKGGAPTTNRTLRFGCRQAGSPCPCRRTLASRLQSGAESSTLGAELLT